MEIEINSDDQKISNNKLRYYFNDITKFENNKVALMECMFRTYFENIKSNYTMRVKYEGGFYNINFIDAQLEIFDTNYILHTILFRKDLNYTLMKIFKKF